MSEEKRLQTVLDVDQTLIHANAASVESIARDQVFRPSSSESDLGLSLFEIYNRRAQRGGSDTHSQIYQKLHVASFAGTKGTVTFAFKIRPHTFEAVSRLRRISDLHIYSKGQRPYIHRVMKVMFGKFTKEGIINGEVITKDEDSTERKDLSFMFDAKEGFNHVVCVDDQAPVWLQLHNVVALPPFFGVPFGVSKQDVRRRDDVHETEGGHLLHVAQTVEKLHERRLRHPGTSVVDGLQIIRSQLFSKEGQPEVRILVPKLCLSVPQESFTMLCNAFQLHGGAVQSAADGSVTHLVSDNVQYCTQRAGIGSWVEGCREAKTVSVQWLIDSVLYAQRMDEGAYHPSHIGACFRMDRAFGDEEVNNDGGVSLAMKSFDHLKKCMQANKDALKMLQQTRLWEAQRAVVVGALLIVAAAHGEALPTMVQQAYFDVTKHCRIFKSDTVLTVSSATLRSRDRSGQEQKRRRTDNDVSRNTADIDRSKRDSPSLFVVKSVPQRSLLHPLVRPNDRISAWLMAKTPQPLPVKWLQQYPTPTKHSRVATPPAKGLVDKWERSRKEKCLTIEVQRLPYDPLNIDHVYTEGRCPIHCFRTFIKYMPYLEIGEAAITAALVAVAAVVVGEYCTVEVVPLHAPQGYPRGGFSGAMVVQGIQFVGLKVAWLDAASLNFETQRALKKKWLVALNGSPVPSMWAYRDVERNPPPVLCFLLSATRSDARTLRKVPPPPFF